MTQLCRMCNKQYSKRADFDKLLPYVPSVCSEKCFVRFLNMYPEDGKMVTAKYIHNKRLKETRSIAEDKVLAWFDLWGVDAAYEMYYVQLDKMKYLPDIYLPEYDLFVEVKCGLLQPTAFSKVVAASKRINIIVIDSIFSRQIGCGTAYTDMQKQHGGASEKRRQRRR